MRNILWCIVWGAVSCATVVSQDLTTTEVFIYGCPADHTRPCVPKCCDVEQGYSMENRSVCVWSNETFRPNFADCPSYLEDVAGVPVAERFEYFIGNPCTNGKYMLEPDMFPEDTHILYSNGSLLHEGRFFTMADYCLETIQGETRVFMCFDAVEAPSKFQYILYPIGLLMSIPFLLVTAGIYLAIDAFRDMLGQALACQVICLAVAYFFLALVQLASSSLNEDLCIAAAFIIQFFFVACFFWLNVLSYEVWSNLRQDFRHYRKFINTKSERLKFIYYSLYAWYGPFMLTIVSLVMDLDPGVPDFLLKPRFGVHSCWFNSDKAALPYFYGPMGFLILINVVLFIWSSVIIYKEKKRANPHTRVSDFSDVEIPNQLRAWIKPFKQCFKLFCVMGVNWVAEIASWAIGGVDVVWIVSDVFNTLQGLIIFYIFVINDRKVNTVVKKAMDNLWGKISRCDMSYHEDNRSNNWYPDIGRQGSPDVSALSSQAGLPDETKVSSSDESETVRLESFATD